MRALVQHGAKVDVANKKGQSPLASATRSNKDMSQILPILKAAADPAAK